MAAGPPVKKRKLSSGLDKAVKPRDTEAVLVPAQSRQYEKSISRPDAARKDLKKLSISRYRTNLPKTHKSHHKRNGVFKTNGQETEDSHSESEDDHKSKEGRTEKSQQSAIRLPTKTSQGIIRQAQSDEEDVQDDANGWLDSSDEEAMPGQADEGTPEPEEPQISQRQQIITAKEELARLALLLNQDPEENSSAFKSLSQIGATENIAVKKLALATQMTVFKDVIPGYRIRPLSEKDANEKVSKEVKQKRAAEQALVRYYQKYVSELSICAKKGQEGTGVKATAISCACQLLLAVPHFNFRSELLQILINKLSHRRLDDDQSRKCIKTLEQIFSDDEDGIISLDAVRLITQAMKARKWNVDEALLNTFLHLRLLSEFNSKASTSTVDRPQESNGKNPKQKREYRSKKQRKQIKELKAAEKDFQEADAVVGHEERDKKQAETLKIVFATYFKILKAKIPHLTGAVLEGLASFAHLINQDFFGDLLEVFKELGHKAAAQLDPDDNELEAIESPAPKPEKDAARTTLLCITTAFALLSAQDITRLSLDLSSFTHLLYNLLLPYLSLHPDLEFSHKTPRLSDPHSSSPEAAPKINVSTTSTLLIRALTSALSARNTPPTRLAAFTHRILLTALHTPERSSQAMLGLLTELATAQGKKMRALWFSEERRGDGEFDALADVDACRAYAGSVWEGELLRLHYAPGVARAVAELEGVVAEVSV